MNTFFWQITTYNSQTTISFLTHLVRCTSLKTSTCFSICIAISGKSVLVATSFKISFTIIMYYKFNMLLLLFLSISLDSANSLSFKSTNPPPVSVDSQEGLKLVYVDLYYSLCINMSRILRRVNLNNSWVKGGGLSSI